MDVDMSKACSSDLPAVDVEAPSRTEKATFALGCFWSPEAQFGCTPGVVRTRVGYAGGTTQNPTYHHLGDHIETIQVEFDPTTTSYEALLEHFWQRHDPTRRPVKRQYTSAVFPHNEQQHELAQRTREQVDRQVDEEVTTEIIPDGSFHVAEEYHQKYHLQQQPALRDEFHRVYPDFQDFINSTATARVNGYVAGFGTSDALEKDMGRLGLSPSGREKLRHIIQAGRKQSGNLPE